MLIEEKQVDFKQCIDRKVYFVIEHFNLPAGLTGFTIHLDQPECLISTLLIYDSQHQLRYQLNQLMGSQKIRISESKEQSSLSAVSGPIPEGQWIMALELPQDQADFTRKWSYFIEAIPF